jgi:hypothetical protein
VPLDRSAARYLLTHALLPAPTHTPTHTTQTVHFWAPTFKWGISIANVADMQRPPDKLSVPQQCGECCVWRRWLCVGCRQSSSTVAYLSCCTGALTLPDALLLGTHPRGIHTPVCPTAITATGLIWTRYSTQIRPVNYNLMTVSVA